MKTRTYVTKAEPRTFVGQSATDGEAFWFVNTKGVRTSPFFVNLAQVTMWVWRNHGPMISWDPIMYGVHADYAFLPEGEE